MKTAGEKYETRLLRQTVDVGGEGDGAEIVGVRSGGNEGVMEEVEVITAVARDCHVVEKETV